MEQTQNRYAIALNEAHQEVHFSIHGLWTVEAMQQFLRELTHASRPYLEWSVPFTVIADMDEFVPQNRDTAETIRAHLQCARGFGLQRLAIVTQSPLVRMQYRRLAEGLEVAFFDTKMRALCWSRGLGTGSISDAA